MRFKILFVLVFILAFAKTTTAQSNAEEEIIRKVVEDFFIGFHHQDSLTMKKVVHPNVLLQSIGKNKTGEVVLSKQDFSNFLNTVCSIPDTTDFEEQIHNYEIKMDGKMANVWTGYSFYINGVLSHCGTNSFQLFKQDGIWKIFYIVDTRDREGCAVKRG